MKRMIKIVVSLLLCFSSLGIVFAEGTIDPDQKGTIHIKKYEKITETVGNYEKNEDIPGETIPDCEFRLIPVMNAQDTMDYIDSDTTLTINDFMVNGKVDESKIISEYDIQTKVTDEDGEIDFTDVKVGTYIIEESRGSDAVNSSKIASPQLITMPTMIGETDWIYDLYVYPKNELTTSQVGLIKYGQAFQGQEGSIRLEGVTFKLEKRVNGTWKAIYAKSTVKGDNRGELYPLCEEGKSIFITDAEGKIAIDGLSNGHYRFKEVDIGNHEGMIRNDDDFIFDIVDGVASFENFEKTYYSRANDHLIEIVNYQPTIAKTVSNKKDSYSVGDKVNFQIKVFLPGNIYTLKTFRIKDEPTSLKVLDIASVKVNNKVIPSTMYQLTKDHKGGFTLDLKGNGKVLDSWKDYAGKYLYVNYSCEILPSENGIIKNNAVMNYSSVTGENNSPLYDDDTALDFLGGEVEFKCFDLVVQKLFSGSVSNKQGVNFELSKDKKTILFKKNSKGIYYPSSNGTKTLTTNSKGVIHITGLGNNTYLLKETKTISNYNMLKDPIKIIINYDRQNGKAIPLSKKALEIKNNKAYIEVMNKKGFDLPRTSGYGLVAISLVGIVSIYLGFKFIYLRKDEESI